jgi:hypothetical protein
MTQFTMPGKMLGGQPTRFEPITDDRTREYVGGLWFSVLTDLLIEGAARHGSA